MVLVSFHGRSQPLLASTLNFATHVVASIIEVLLTQVVKLLMSS